MKPTSYVLLPLLATGLAACGSAQTSQPPSKAQRADAPPSLPLQPRPDTPKATGNTPQDRATAATPGGAAATAEPKATAKGSPKGTPPKSATVGAPHRAELGVSGRFVFPAAAVVGARAGFEITLRSFDGKAHTVKLATPTPRAVNVTAKRIATIKFPAISPGTYPVEVDGNRRVGALLVIDPSGSGKRGLAPASSAK